VSLVARHLEANGLPTVVVGSARDIVETCGVARFVFSDFPLGNPCGAPHDRAMQRRIVEITLDLLEHATLPRTTVQTPFVWQEGDDSWKDRYARVDESNREALRRQGERRRQRQQEAAAAGRTRSD